MKEVFDAIKANKAAPSWKNYQDYVNSLVIDGIFSGILTALTHLNDLISPNIKRTADQCLFEIKLELQNDGVHFDPEIEETSVGTTVRNVIRLWINEIFAFTSQVQRIDTT